MIRTIINILIKKDTLGGRVADRLCSSSPTRHWHALSDVHSAQDLFSREIYFSASPLLPHSILR